MKKCSVRNNSGDDWKTPDDFYKKLDEVYHFDFDPCPYQADFVSTSTALFHEVILPNAKKIEFIRGRLKFEQKDKNGVFHTKGCGQHDSMIVEF